MIRTRQREKSDAGMFSFCKDLHSVYIIQCTVYVIACTSLVVGLIGPQMRSAYSWSCDSYTGRSSAQESARSTCTHAWIMS